jgi:hypothetical protein
MNSRTHGLRASGMKRHAMTQSTVDFRMPIDRYPSEVEASKSADAPAPSSPVENDSGRTQEHDRDSKG